MSKPTLLVTKRSQRISESTKAIRKGLFKAAKSAVDQQQDAIRGFALVVWDDRGVPYIAASTGTDGNPISTPLLPSYVGHQLQRYVLLDDKSADRQVVDLL